MVFFVYIDWTLEDLPRAFYIGKGQLVRVHEQERDNDHWRNIVAKRGFRREVILATKDESYAFTQEILGILEHGTFCGSTQHHWGANKTAGGEGISGYVHTQAARQKISEAHIGKVLSLETRQKLSNIASQRIGNKSTMFGKHHSEQVRANMSKVKHDLYSTERGQEIKQQISETLTGRKLSEEHKSNVGKVGLGRRHTNEAIQKMKTHEFSDEHRRKLSEAAKRRKYI